MFKFGGLLFLSIGLIMVSYSSYNFVKQAEYKFFSNSVPAIVIDHGEKAENGYNKNTFIFEYEINGETIKTEKICYSYTPCYKIGEKLAFRYFPSEYTPLINDSDRTTIDHIGKVSLFSLGRFIPFGIGFIFSIIGFAFYKIFGAIENRMSKDGNRPFESARI